MTNGLLLRGDLHNLYDQGLIAIDPLTMKVIIAPRLKDTDYSNLAGVTVRLPQKLKQYPSQTALEMHVNWAKSIWK